MLWLLRKNTRNTLKNRKIKKGGFKFNDETLKTAVNEWCKDKTTAEAKYSDISNWDTSSVTNMRSLFKDKRNFNDDISKWDVSNVTDMTSMFNSVWAFNQPIGSWNVSSVTTMEFMFYNAPAFNQPIGSWNVSNVTNMSWMFYGTAAFNQPIGSWNVSNWRLCMWTSFRLFNPNCSHGTVIHFRGIHKGHM